MNINLEQFLTNDDIEKSERAGIEQLKLEQRILENTQLATNLKNEIERVFEWKRDIIDIRDWTRNISDKVEVRIKLRDLEKSVDCKTIRRYINQFDTGIYIYVWPTKPELVEAILNCESTYDATARVSIHVNDSDFDKRLKTIFDLVREIFPLRPKIRSTEENTDGE